MVVATPGNQVSHSRLGTGAWTPACPQAGGTRAFFCLSTPRRIWHTVPLPRPGIPHPLSALMSHLQDSACPSVSPVVPRAHPHSDGDVHRSAELWHTVVVHLHCHHHLPPLIFQGLAVQRLLAVHLTCGHVDGEVVAE